jgi:hypothetical protein
MDSGTPSTTEPAPDPGAEAPVDERVGEEKHGDTDEHPQTGLPRLDVHLGLRKQVERNRSDHCSGSEPAENSDELGGHRDPADEEPRDEQRRLREKSPAERFDHESILRFE